MATPEPKIGDAFGEALLACWQSGVAPGASFEIIERDDGFLGVTDATFYFQTHDQWNEAERWACDRVRGRILDVGCGAGRHAAVLTAAGYDVVGLDPSHGAIEVCRARGVNAVLGEIADVGPELGQFDTFLLAGNNLGLLGGLAQGPGVLRRLASVAAPGAQVLGIGMDPLATSDPVHQAYHRRNLELGRLPGQIRMRVRHRLLATLWFDYLFPAASDLADIVEKAQWTVERLEPGRGHFLATLRLNE